jgi:hypothetical protein
MEIYFGNPRYPAQQNILETWLRRGRHGDGVAITAKPRGDPENVDFGKWRGVAHYPIARHSTAFRSTQIERGSPLKE